MTMNWRKLLAGPVFALMAVPFASAGEGAAGLPDGLYARIMTNKGEIICKLEFIKVPMTVMNFVGLAEGKLDTTVKKGQPYFDGIVFHRVVPGFVIQGGDPSGNGTGGPGYRFPDEFDVSLTHKSEGILSMANAGAGTNGSQFFITLDETPHLDNRHSVFGEVVRGMDVVKKIKVGDKMEKVEIIRVGTEAQAFVPSQEAFDNLKKNQATRAEKMKALTEQGSRVSRAEPNVVADKLAKNAAALKEAGTDADTLKWLAQATEWAKQSKKSKGGSLYVVLKEGTGDTPRKGQKVAADYTGRLLTGTVFDSSIPRGEPIEFPVGKQNVIAGWDEALSEMKVGEKRALFIPSDQAYGDRGAGGAIPPKAMLFFEVERVK